MADKRDELKKNEFLDIQKDRKLYDKDIPMIIKSKRSIDNDRDCNDIIKTEALIKEIS